MMMTMKLLLLLPLLLLFNKMGVEYDSKSRQYNVCFGFDEWVKSQRHREKKSVLLLVNAASKVRMSSVSSKHGCCQSEASELFLASSCFVVDVDVDCFCTQSKKSKLNLWNKDIT
jgi:hypothetical protein